jgi:hypothetical protein
LQFLRILDSHNSNKLRGCIWSECGSLSSSSSNSRYIEFAGIFVGGNKVVHFSPERNSNSNSSTWICSDSSFCKSAGICSSYPECGFRQPNSGVLRSCLDCFLGNGSLYRFEYGVSRSFFFAQVRGGTCSFAKSDPPEQVIHRALYLLQYGFGNYDVFLNNCEDFALYCKTGLRAADGKKTTGGQASSFLSVPWAAIASSPLKWVIPNPVGVATVTAGMYCMSRYANDFGVRDDVIKVAVEDLAENMGWEANEGYLVQMNSGMSSYLFYLFEYCIIGNSIRCFASPQQISCVNYSNTTYYLLNYYFMFDNSKH